MNSILYYDCSLQLLHVARIVLLEWSWHTDFALATLPLLFSVLDFWTNVIKWVQNGPVGFEKW